LALLPQVIEAGHDDALDRLRNARFRWALHELVTVFPAAQDAEIDQSLGNLFDEQRHTFGLLEERRANLLRKAVAAEHLLGHRQRVGWRQRAKVDRGMEAPVTERGLVTETERGEGEDRGRGDRVEELLQKLLGARVDPV